MEGKRLKQVCKTMDISETRGRQLCAELRLPTNPSCTPGGRVEARIIRASRVLTLRELATFFNHSPVSMKAILARVDSAARKDVVKGAGRKSLRQGYRAH